MILRAKNLSKAFQFPKKVEVLKSIDLTIEPGESIAITGRSGEGKTTLLHILGALEKPDTGIIEIHGQKITPSNASKARSNHIGFVFQSYNLLEDFTALENVLMPAKIAKRRVDIEEGFRLLDAVGLKERADFPAKLLSGGERQRVAIARALCNDPELILADEPSGNLDAKNGEEIAELLFSLVTKRDKSLILVTHDKLLADRCNKKYILSEGHLSD